MVSADIKNNNDEEVFFKHFDTKTFDDGMCKSEYVEENAKVAKRDKVIGTDYSYKHEWVWKNVIGFIILHSLTLLGVFKMITAQVYFLTSVWAIFYAFFCTEGVTIGAHRLFAHRTFKAHPILKALLLVAQTAAGQNSVYIWCRDHRLHHRYSDTDADPHNSKRGFFFCHMGWLMMKKHPHVRELGRTVDMSDLKADAMVMWQLKYYYYLYIVAAILFPVWVPIRFFGETWWNSFVVAYVARYMIQLNGTWLVNSAAHLCGTRPYDKKIQPVESWFVSMISLGEGWHNYHHAFPWDYKAAELTSQFNQSAKIIEFFERIGLAYDLKTAAPTLVQGRIVRSGDGTHGKLSDDEVMRRALVGPLHPLNPFYTVAYDPPDTALKNRSLALNDEKDQVVFNDRIPERAEG